MTAPFLPTLNAFLNASSALFLLAGYAFIRKRKVLPHRISMVLAFICSTVFLISYLTYHTTAGATRYQGQGALRTIYFVILVSHTVLAAVLPPMAVLTLVRALKGDVIRHRKLARRTLPIWLYVSFTGVAIYWMLYKI